MDALIVIMLDGISADAVTRHGARLPHLTALAARGTRVERLEADVPATSLPGRTSILTGVDASHHGVYGNLIWDGGRFRYANPDDVSATPLPRHALEHGLDVAVLGYGMVRPEDATTFHHAWWAGEMLQRARDEAPIPADEGWLRTARHVDASGRIAELAALGLADGVPDAYAGDRLHYLLSEVSGDQIMLQWTAAAHARSAAPPHLTLTEVLTPDSIQHVAGPEHPFSLWSLSYADALVGEVVRALDEAGRLATTRIVVLSDHGHGAVEGALYLDTLLPDATVASEGGVLYVAVDGTRDAERVARRLREHGVVPLPGDHLPSAQRDAVAAFTSERGRIAFEATAPAERVGTPSGPSRYASGHGFAPGTPSDERFLIAAGPGIATRRVPRARSADVAATLCALLGLPTLGDGETLC